jgi:hypothetical protein
MTQNLAQNPLQNDAANANKLNGSQKGSSSALFNDDTFVAIHDAFLLGWSLFELRSRVLIASVPAFTTKPASSVPAQPNQPANQPNVPAPQNKAVAELASELVTLVMKDVINIVQSFASLQFQKIVSDFQILPTDLVDNAWLTSVWRAVFRNIVATHKSCLSGGDTSNTIYDPPDKSMLSYLYPEPPFRDYTEFGIRSNTQLPETFRLYDVTRRALNCLTLLLTDPNDSLVPDDIRALQDHLLQNLTNNPDASSANPADKNSGLKILSGLNVTFLMEWDGYVRENLFVSSDVGNNEIMLIAYEAGRSLAGLSWSVSAVAAPLENALRAAQQDQNILQQLNNNKDLAKQLSNAWLNVFDARDIAHIQYQISALSTALDDAYYRVHPDMQRPDPKAALVQANPALPSQAIHAITHSLDYWQRTVELMCAAASDTTATQLAAVPPLNWERSRKLREKLIEQADAWQALLLCQQNLLDFTGEKVTQRILQDCMADFEDAAQAVKREAEQETQSWLKAHMPVVITVIALGVLLLAVLVAVGVVLYQTNQLPALATAITLVGGGVLGLFSASIGRLNSILSPAPAGQAAGSPGAPDNSNLAQSLAGIGLFGLAGSTLASSFRDAYEQIMIDFADLNHNVAISFPVIEFFVEYSTGIAEANKDAANTSAPAIASAGGIKQDVDNLIKDGYDFLTKIIWTQQDRDEEIQRVAHAAFGPLGLFLGAQVTSAKATITDQASKALKPVSQANKPKV